MSSGLRYPYRHRLVQRRREMSPKKCNKAWEPNVLYTRKGSELGMPLRSTKFDWRRIVSDFLQWHRQTSPWWLQPNSAPIPISIELANVPVRFLEYILNDVIIHLNIIIFCKITEKATDFLKNEVRILNVDTVEWRDRVIACPEIRQTVSISSNDTPNYTFAIRVSGLTENVEHGIPNNTSNIVNSFFSRTGKKGLKEILRTWKLAKRGV